MFNNGGVVGRNNGGVVVVIIGYMAAIPYLTIMIGGSTKRRNLLTIGFRILDRSLLRSLEIFRLEMVKTAPRRPPMIPRQAAGRNISTFTDMESPTLRQNAPFPTKRQNDHGYHTAI